MKITTKEVRGTVQILNDIIKEYKEETKEEKHIWRNIIKETNLKAA